MCSTWKGAHTHNLNDMSIVRQMRGEKPEEWKIIQIGSHANWGKVILKLGLELGVAELKSLEGGVEVC